MFETVTIETIPAGIQRTVTDERKSKNGATIAIPYSLFLIPSSYSQPTSNSVRFVPK